MAGPYYVDDGGDNGDGLTWATAKTTLAVGLALAAAGETVYVGSDHQEDENATKTLASSGTKAAPVYVISADKTSGAPPATYQSMATGGGDIETTGAADDINFTGSAIYVGLKFDAGDVFQTASTDHVTRFVDCTIIGVDALNTGAAEGLSEFIGCTLTLSSSVRGLADGTTIFRNCVFTSVAAGGHFTLDLDSHVLLVEDCDLSNEADLFSDLSGNRVRATLRRCKLATSWNLVSGAAINGPQSWVLIESSQDGNNTVPVPGLVYYADYFGTIEHDAVEYRTGGASDGETPYSWKMTCNSNTISRHAALKTPPITGWKDAGSETLTVYVAHDAVGDGAAGDLQNDECWLEISSPDETANPNTTAQGKYQTTLPATVLTAAADLANEGSDQWQGSPTSYQEITATIAPAEAGPIVVRVCLATGASSIVWVDPKLYLTVGA